MPKPSAPRPAVMALKRVVLPAPAGPTMATFTGKGGADGGPAERFGAQAARMLGAGEHRSERIR